jgi:O-antigen/teichoic acid export membrane protein
VAGNIGVFILGVASIKLLTNMMDATAYGKFALALTIAGSFNLFVYGPFGQFVTRFCTIYQKRNRLVTFIRLAFTTYSRYSKYALLASFVVVVIIGVMFHDAWWGLVALACVLGITAGGTTTLIAIQTALRKRSTVALHQVAEALIRLLLAVLLIYWIGQQAQLVILSYVVATLIVTVTLFKVVLQQTGAQRLRRQISINRDDSKDYRQKLREYMVPFVCFALFTAVGTYGDRWLLQAWYGESEVGVYAAMYQLANAPIVLLLGIANQFSHPIVFQHTAESHSSRNGVGDILYRLVMIGSIVVLGSVTILSLVYGEVIMKTFTSESFSIQHDTLWILVSGLGLFHLGQQMTLKGFYLNKPGIYIMPKILQAASFLVVATTMLSLGIKGIAIAFSVSAAIYLTAVVVVNRNVNTQRSV